MADSHEDQEFLEYVVKHLVDNPEEVNVDRDVDEMGVLLTLDVAADDMGKVIGRNGNTAKALRTLLRVVGMKNQARVNLKIREPEDRGEGNADDTTDEGEDEDPSDAVDQAMDELKS